MLTHAEASDEEVSSCLHSALAKATEAECEGLWAVTRCRARTKDRKLRATTQWALREFARHGSTAGDELTKSLKRAVMARHECSKQRDKRSQAAMSACEPTKEAVRPRKAGAS